MTTRIYNHHRHPSQPFSSRIITTIKLLLILAPESRLWTLSGRGDGPWRWGRSAEPWDRMISRTQDTNAYAYYLVGCFKKLFLINSARTIGTNDKPRFGAGLNHQPDTYLDMFVRFTQILFISLRELLSRSHQEHCVTPLEPENLVSFFWIVIPCCAQICIACNNTTCIFPYVDTYKQTHTHRDTRVQMYIHTDRHLHKLTSTLTHLHSRLVHTKRRAYIDTDMDTYIDT